MARVNKERFMKRMTKIYELWNNENEEEMSKADSILFIAASGDDSYSKSASIQIYLFNTILVDTVVLLTKNGIYFLGSSKKATYVESVKSTTANGIVPPIHIMYREKADKDKGNIAKLCELISKEGGHLGFFVKDKQDTEFTKDVFESIKKHDPAPEIVDISQSFATLFAVKLPEEIELMRKSCLSTTNAWKLMKTKIINAVDMEKKIRHNKFADDIEKEMVEVPVQGELANFCESSFTPIVQSGSSKFVLKFSAQSPETPINYGCIVGIVSCRYRSYCSAVGRTMLVEPDAAVEKQYETLLVMESEIMRALVPGAALSDVYQSAINFLKKNAPELVGKLAPGPFGFCTGLEFRDATLAISPKCNAVVKPNMIFVVNIGLTDLPYKSLKKEAAKDAALFVCDTVLVGENGPAENLTAVVKNRVKSFIIRVEQETRKPAVEILEQGKRRTVIMEDQTRHKLTNEDKRKKKQLEIGERLNEEARARLAGTTTDNNAPAAKKSTVSYKVREKMPDESELYKLQIYVDKKNDSIIVPIYGVPVPFHISMVKNCSHSEEGDYFFLRINFFHPGSQIGREMQNNGHPLHNYIKELSFRSSTVKEPGELSAPSENLMTALRLIKDLQKKYRTQEAEEKEKEGAVKQDKLRLNPPGNKMAPRLKDLYVRPNIIAKRVTGTLEAHVNGFRYHSIRGDDIDVLYNNIKHAFFQPCDNEMIILIHFHLKNPVLWGKKKYIDIQFFTEVGEITTDLGKYHHMQDRDDIQSEQQEREMRKKLNQAFQSFCEKVTRQTNEAVDFDQPFNQLAFTGVPYRSSVILKPTSSCLVNLTEWPPLVITLDEVELVSFERVSFQIRNFDMVFVFKDYTRRVQTINSIPSTSLDSIKEWLNSCDIRYFEGIQSLNWGNIMKTILKDPQEFFENGGWNFLNPSSDAEQENLSEESEDAYEPTDDEEVSGEDESEDEESDAVSDEEEDSSEEGSLDSDESEGKDWSDLEEEAARADRDKERVEVTKRPGMSFKGGPPPKRRK
uniref:FACT complex subunit n=1 Tax=Panagrolaimus sp. JU765 TaxID=591449 RepID=A0AC34QIB4_9BILA